ncbi:MAG: pilus assembly protein N-terminal domain-containing protein [Alphaproteobacteria bacterium]|nr:pilus assembly protein N-terminal domain-containing protein [Alphaproteobacteria bacterium]
MHSKPAVFLATFLALAACSSSTPRIIQTTSGVPEVRLTVGRATQIEMPEDVRVQSVASGNPSLVTAENSGDVVSLVAKGPGETNLIIRARDDDNDVKVYQYRVTVQER